MQEPFHMFVCLSELESDGGGGDGGGGRRGATHPQLWNEFYLFYFIFLWL